MNGSEQAWTIPDAGPSFWVDRRMGTLIARSYPPSFPFCERLRKTKIPFFVSEIAFIATDKPIHFCGILDELSTFLTNGKHQFIPEYWWPADHSWCVCSDYDLAFTIVAGSKELVSAVLNDATLEAIEVSSQTRVDSNAPMPR